MATPGWDNLKDPDAVRAIDWLPFSERFSPLDKLSLIEIARDARMDVTLTHFELTHFVEGAPLRMIEGRLRIDATLGDDDEFVTLTGLALKGAGKVFAMFNLSTPLKFTTPKSAAIVTFRLRVLPSDVRPG